MSIEAYITLAELVAAWPAFAVGRDADEQQAIVDAANAAVRNYVGRDLLLAERTELHSGDGRGRLFLSVVPVVSVSTVYIRGQALDNTDGTAWSFNPDTGALTRGDGYSDVRFAPPFPGGVDNIEVTYTGGYDPIPFAVKRAAILTAKGLDTAFVGGGPYKSESIGSYSYALADGVKSSGMTAGGIPTTAATLLAPYRVIHIGRRS